MTSAETDWPAKLQALRQQLDHTLALAARHAGGEVDAQEWAHACAALAQAFADVRSWAQAGRVQPPPTPEVAALLSDIGQRMQWLHEQQARLSAANRQALAQLLPQDDLQAYTQLGRRRPGVGRGGYG
ncbi:MAG: hypothetical protein AB1371_03785 [Pseudomonadota bacterium]